MITDHIAVQTVSRSATKRTLHWPLGADRVSALTALIPRLSGAVARSAKIALMPHAALWEASVVVSLINGADRVDSDSFPNQTYILADDGFWLRFRAGGCGTHVETSVAAAADPLNFASSTRFVRGVAEYLREPPAGEDLLLAEPITESAAFGKFVSDQLFVEQLLQTCTEQVLRMSSFGNAGCAASPNTTLDVEQP